MLTFETPAPMKERKSLSVRPVPPCSTMGVGQAGQLLDPL